MNSQAIKYRGLKPPKMTLLSKEQVLSLRPKDRDNYVEKIIRELLIANSKGITVSEIEAITELNRSTITKHLKKLVATREAHSQKRGNLSIYYNNGEVTLSRSILDSIAKKNSYVFYRLLNDDGKFIYIQEIKTDYYGKKEVAGGIMIKDEDFLKFMVELQKFAMEVK